MAVGDVEVFTMLLWQVELFLLFVCINFLDSSSLFGFSGVIEFWLLTFPFR